MQQSTAGRNCIVGLVCHETEVGSIAALGHVDYPHPVLGTVAAVWDIPSVRLADSPADCTGSDQGEASVRIVVGRRNAVELHLRTDLVGRLVSYTGRSVDGILQKRLEADIVPGEPGHYIHACLIDCSKSNRSFVADFDASNESQHSCRHHRVLALLTDPPPRKLEAIPAKPPC